MSAAQVLALKAAGRLVTALAETHLTEEQMHPLRNALAALCNAVEYSPLNDPKASFALAASYLQQASDRS